MNTLYACPNVRTVTNGAQLNLPPMKAFRAPGYTEGTFGLECLLDELAAKLGVDPLELRRRNHADTVPGEGSEYSSKNLLECYRRAEPHWERRHEVRARSTDTVKRGVGLASQIWWGGGGPPSYAWIRVGSNGHAAVVTAGQDVGTGVKTAFAQIAAEELGIPLAHVTVAVGDSVRGPYATLSAGSSTIPSMGPAVRAAAGHARQQILDLAASATASIPPSSRSPSGSIVFADGRREPLGELLEPARKRADPRRGRPRPEPGRAAGADLRRPGRRGRRRHRDGRGDRRAHRRDPRHRPRDQPARRLEPDRGRDHPGDRPHALRGAPHRPGHRLHPHAHASTPTGCRRSPTFPEIIGELIDSPDAQLTNLGSKGIGEPPIIPTSAAIANAIRDATGADIRSLPITRAEVLAALEEARRRERPREGPFPHDGHDGLRLVRRRASTTSRRRRAPC